jgi:hypothetical protein
VSRNGRQENPAVDLHHNLFYSYRGPISDDADRDRQLENNLTKALINTLKLGGETVWRPFLDNLDLAGRTASDFLLQRHDVPGGAKNRKKRVLLGISKQGSAWSLGIGAETATDSLPDGWVYGDGFAVLVETKVNGDFSPGQMQAHLELLRPSEGPPPKIELMTWKQIHRLFASVLPNQEDAASRLLVKQFIQFLEYSGMSGFTGFRREHFDYFVLHDDDDARRWIIDQVHDFAAQVQAELYTFAPFYEDYDIGPLKSADSYCWCALGPRDKSYRDVTHQTMAISANGLSLFVNAELKTATDRVKRVLHQAGNALRDALLNLHNPDEPFEVVLQERRQRQASLYDYTPKLRIHSSMLANPNTRQIAWDAFSQTVQQLPLFQLMIERLVPPSRLLALSTSDPPGAVQHIVEILKRNHAVVSLLNE